MAEIIFIVMIIAAIVVIGIAWTFARSRSRRGLSWTAETKPISMDLMDLGKTRDEISPGHRTAKRVPKI